MRNENEARLLYQQKYPERRIPNNRTFRRIEDQLRQTGSLTRQRRTIKTDEEKETSVLLSFIENRRTSIRTVARNLELSKSCVHAVLKKFKFKPFRDNLVQALHEGDADRRLMFCHWLRVNYRTDFGFLNKILWSDESCFSNCGMENRHNVHTWSDVNPQATRDKGFQRRFSVNVWCGIIGTKIIGPFFFHGHLNGDKYLEFLQTTFSDYLRDLPLSVFRNIIFQQDGAPAHNTRAVINFLNNRFPNCWMGTNGPVRWPPRSPDLTPCDFFLWGYIKDIVYATIPENEEDLRHKITRAVESITTEMLQLTIRNIIKRVECCIDHDGNNFEPFLN
jgi:hypothetical protein